MARVLVVEDDDAALELLTQELESAGHDVRVVRDGEEAYVALFRAWPVYDLLVCDVELSRMPGRDLLARVAAQVRSRTPVLVVGGNERLLDGLGEVEEWIFDILRKPIEPEDLHLKLERALAHRETLRVGEDAQSGIACTSWSDASTIWPARTSCCSRRRVSTR